MLALVWVLLAFIIVRFCILMLQVLSNGSNLQSNASNSFRMDRICIRMLQILGAPCFYTNPSLASSPGSLLKTGGEGRYNWASGKVWTLLVSEEMKRNPIFSSCSWVILDLVPHHQPTLPCLQFLIACNMQNRRVKFGYNSFLYCKRPVLVSTQFISFSRIKS